MQYAHSYSHQATPRFGALAPSCFTGCHASPNRLDPSPPCYSTARSTCNLACDVSGCPMRWRVVALWQASPVQFSLPSSLSGESSPTCRIGIDRVVRYRAPPLNSGLPGLTSHRTTVECGGGVADCALGLQLFELYEEEELLLDLRGHCCWKQLVQGLDCA